MSHIDNNKGIAKIVLIFRQPNLWVFATHFVVVDRGGSRGGGGGTPKLQEEGKNVADMCANTLFST